MTFTLPVLLIQSSAKPHERLCNILSCEPFKVVAKVEALDNARICETRTEFPRIIVVCLSRGAISLEAVAEANRLFPTTKIVVVTERYDHHEMIGAFRIGAVAYLLKEISSIAMANALSLAATEDMVLLAGRNTGTGHGESLNREVFGMNGAIADSMANPLKKPMTGSRTGAMPGSSSSGARQPQAPASALSPRETTILDLVKEGDSNKHIARKLGIAEATVKCHVKAILRKINVRNRFDAAMWALRADGLQQRQTQAPPAERECSHSFATGRPAQLTRTPDAA